MEASARISDDDVDTSRLLATFISSSADIERYLQQLRPLTDLEYETLALTISGLRDFLDIWKQKHGVESDLP